MGPQPGGPAGRPAGAAPAAPAARVGGAPPGDARPW